jgi:hypothetical protein
MHKRCRQLLTQVVEAQCRFSIALKPLVRTLFLKAPALQNHASEHD